MLTHLIPTANLLFLKISPLSSIIRFQHINYYIFIDITIFIYDSSYKFMKDISVTLGKIEERFGEKLNSLNDKVSHLDRISNETSEEIEDKKYDRDNLLNELMESQHLRLYRLIDSFDTSIA